MTGSVQWLTVRSTVLCGHDGVVRTQAGQSWLRVGGAAVLVDPDPEGRPVVGCPNVGPTVKPCTTTLAVDRGYRPWLVVDGHAVVGSDLDGLTDGTVPGTVHYAVRDPRQPLVRADP